MTQTTLGTGLVLLPSTREAERKEKPEFKVSLDLIARLQITITVQTTADNLEVIMRPAHKQASMQARKASLDPHPVTYKRPAGQKTYTCYFSGLCFGFLVGVLGFSSSFGD